jgi:hypothetical protein
MSRTTITLRTLSVAALAAAVLLASGSPAASAPVQAARSLDISGLTGPNWRADHARTFAKMPELRTTAKPTGLLSGTIVAGTINLPATIELSGDTTILARQLVFEGRDIRITARGHHLRVLPIDTVTAQAQAQGRAALAGPFGRSSITIDVSGAAGETFDESGTPGGKGLDGGRGYDGWHGDDGDDGEYFFGWPCYFDPGDRGEDGEAGGEGGRGHKGYEGGRAGSIMFDIPDDDSNMYTFLAVGGSGGEGGTGGPGGPGGDAGNGGDGADAPWICHQSTPGGDAGDGGNGGDGGKGGTGGEGGKGGPGGTIMVTHSAESSPNIVTDASGGAGGPGGDPGLPGEPGHAGEGGRGGDSNGYGNDGRDGRGGRGGALQPGDSGDDGGSGDMGTVSVVPRDPVPRVTVTTDSSSYHLGQAVTYYVTGPVNSPISAFTTVNGRPIDDGTFIGASTDGTGQFTTAFFLTLDDIYVGDWTTTVFIRTDIAQVSFEVRGRP